MVNIKMQYRGELENEEVTAHSCNLQNLMMSASEVKKDEEHFILADRNAKSNCVSLRPLESVYSSGDKELHPVLHIWSSVMRSFAQVLRNPSSRFVLMIFFPDSLLHHKQSYCSQCSG